MPDQYVLRTGLAFALGKSPFAAALGLRMEGLPRYDLIGDSHGFRRPGYETFAEPGVYYSRGGDTWSLNVPIALKRNRRPDPRHDGPDAAVDVGPWWPDSQPPKEVPMLRVIMSVVLAVLVPACTSFAFGGSVMSACTRRTGTAAACAQPSFDSSPGAP